MTVEIVRQPSKEDWILCKQIALGTEGKKLKTPPTEDWKYKILKARHSPIRTLQFCFLIKDLPYWVSTHLVRHVHAIPFVRSQRNDRQDKYDRNSARQDAPVDMYWYMNAEELMTIANKRLCNKASKETREVVKEICRLVEINNEEFQGLLVPACKYNGKCHEIKSCGVKV